MNTRWIYLLFFSTQIAQSMNIPWGMSSRANGKMSYDGLQLRFEQEDTFSYHSISGGWFGTDGHWFGVFDGHGGPHDFYRTCDQLRDNLYDYFANAKGNEQQRLSEAFKDANDKVMDFSARQTNGSTAVVLYVKDGKVHVAHVGDSRAIFFDQNGTVSFKTTDHTLENEQEMTRIKQVYSDKKVFNKRVFMKDDQHGSSKVNGLAMTRSIGDPDIKNKSKTSPSGDGAIIANPDYTSFDQTSCKFALLATDGVWEVMKAEDVSAVVNHALSKRIEQLEAEYPNSVIIVNKKINSQIRGAIRDALGMKESDFNAQYGQKKWYEIIEDEYRFQKNRKELYAAICTRLQCTQEELDLMCASHDNPLLHRMPLIEDAIEDKRGNDTDYDLKLMYAARAVREEAVRRGSGDNILVCLTDLSMKSSWSQRMLCWWQDMPVLQKRGVQVFSVATLLALAAVLYRKYLY